MKSKRTSPIVLTAIMVFFLAVVPASAQWGTPIPLTHNSVMDWGPSISGDGGKIAFYSYVEGCLEIFIINSDGTGLTQLTSNAGLGWVPSISGDGGKIAFESKVDGDFEIFVINSDGTGLTQLTSNTVLDGLPSISGDGSKIAFYSYVDGDSEIFVINSDGTGLTQLTSNTVSGWVPSISGDGSKISFTSNMDGSDNEIYVINSDGTGLTQLTSNTVSDWNPSISADGSKIVFYSNVDGDFEIFVINSDGTGLTQLTSNAGSGWVPSISGDGSKIAFESEVDGDFEIFAINSDGTGLTQLTSNTASDWNPSISADGSKIAFGSEVDGDEEIFVVSYTTSTVPPTCAIALQKNGIPISNINIGDSFDIYVGDSTDDQSIKEVRFSSDGSQEGNPTGEWTDWYGWDTSGDWDATNKVKAWSFATSGDKEVWAEVKDGDGQTDKCSANINANLLPNQPPYFTALWVDSTIDWAEGQIGEAGWEYWCLRFVANAFNLVENPPVPGLSGWVTAWDAANALERYDQGENGWLNAPRGALIFFGQTLHNCGHVGIYLGDGNMIHAWTDGVGEKSVSELATHYIGWAYPPENWFPDSIEAKLECPAELRVHDSQEQITGLVNGVAKNEIPYSGYSEDTVTVLSPSGSNEYEIVGTDEGSYNLAVTYVSEEKTNIFTATDIPTTTGATHEYTIDWAALSQGGEGVTVQVDSDGDGTFEHTFTADNELTQEEFLSGTDGEPIPEFTSIIIPVATVLGLIFLISRRKRKG